MRVYSVIDTLMLDETLKATSIGYRDSSMPWAQFCTQRPYA